MRTGSLDALSPVVAAPLQALIEGVWDGRVDLEIVERSRERICRLLGANTDTARPDTAPGIGVDLDERACACLAFTEQWVLDPHAMTDELAADVTAHLSPSECAAFTIALAVLEAQVRVELTLRALR
jgi:hypothetical protein